MAPRLQQGAGPNAVGKTPHQVLLLLAACSLQLLAGREASASAPDRVESGAECATSPSALSALAVLLHLPRRTSTRIAAIQARLAAVNPRGFRFNCLSRAIAADRTLAGYPAVAIDQQRLYTKWDVAGLLANLSGRPARDGLRLEEVSVTGPLLDLLRANYRCPDCEFSRAFPDLASLEGWLLAHGVERALVYSRPRDRSPEHFSNIVKVGRRYYLFDPQRPAWSVPLSEATQADMVYHPRSERTRALFFLFPTDQALPSSIDL